MSGLEELDLGALEAWLLELVGERVSIDVAGARTGGMSNANLIGRVSGRPRVVVRVPPERGPLAPYDVAAEAGWLRRAAAAGVPVPAVLGVEPGPEPFGVPVLVCQYISGEVLVPAQVTPSRGEAVGRELVRRLVEIQAVDIGAADHGALGAVASDGSRRLLERWGRVFDAEAAQRPVLVGELVRRWLAAHQPSPTGQPVLVHGDFRLGNLIWQGDEVVAVLDWEDAAIGDPLYDLAWLFMGTRRDEDLVMNAWARRRVVDLYVERSGRVVAADALRWWEVAVAWVRMAMEIRLLRLSAAERPPDLRGLVWEFGHGSAARTMLDRIQAAVAEPSAAEAGAAESDAGVPR